MHSHSTSSVHLRSWPGTHDQRMSPDIGCSPGFPQLNPWLHLLFRRMEEEAPTLLLSGAKQLLDLARAETSRAAEAYAMLAARVLSHGAGGAGVEGIADGQLEACGAFEASHGPQPCCHGMGHNSSAAHSAACSPPLYLPLMMPAAARCLDARLPAEESSNSAAAPAAHPAAQQHEAHQRPQHPRPAPVPEGRELSSDEVDRAFSVLSSIDVGALSMGAGGSTLSMTIPGTAAHTVSPAGTLEAAATAFASVASGRTSEGVSAASCRWCCSLPLLTAQSLHAGALAGLVATLCPGLARRPEVLVAHGAAPLACPSCLPLQGAMGHPPTASAASMMVAAARMPRTAPAASPPSQPAPQPAR